MYVGMNRKFSATFPNMYRVPHVRGDEPRALYEHIATN